MKRALFILACLLIACPALVADNKPVVVDPMDLRQPIEEPGAELALKYNGHSVQFTGVLASFGQDQKKNYWYDLQVEVQKPKPADANKKPQANKEQHQTVTVKVFFQQDEKKLRSGKTHYQLTVAGKGEITDNGSLVIHNAMIEKMKEVAAPKR